MVNRSRSRQRGRVGPSTGTPEPPAIFDEIPRPRWTSFTGTSETHFSACGARGVCFRALTPAIRSRASRPALSPAGCSPQSRDFERSVHMVVVPNGPKCSGRGPGMSPFGAACQFLWPGARGIVTLLSLLLRRRFSRDGGLPSASRIWACRRMAPLAGGTKRFSRAESADGVSAAGSFAKAFCCCKRPERTRKDLRHRTRPRDALK